MEILLKGKKALIAGASRGLGKAIAMQLAECGAEVALMCTPVNNILTGFFDTERLNEINKFKAELKGVNIDIYKEKMKTDIPIGRFGTPNEFAYLVAFLA